MKKIVSILSVSILCIAASACGADPNSQSHDAVSATPTPTPAVAEFGPDLENELTGEPTAGLEDELNDLVGMDIAQAEQWALDRNLIVRVVSVDGEEQAVTFDLRLDRINVVVVDGEISEVSTIG